MPSGHSDRIYNILFLCTGNSARSILGESIVNSDGSGRFRGFSAGSQPKGSVHPLALEVLKERDLSLEGLRSKSWEEFSGPEAPKMDFVFTVCGSAAGEVCPVWPGNPVTANWAIEDPAAVEGPGQHQAFVDALAYLRARFALFSNLPIEALDRMTIEARLKEIGRSKGAAGTMLEQAR